MNLLNRCLECNYFRLYYELLNQIKYDSNFYLLDKDIKNTVRNIIEEYEELQLIEEERGE